MFKITLTFIELFQDVLLEVLAALPLALEVDEHLRETSVAGLGSGRYLFVEYFLFNFLQFTTLLNHIQCLWRRLDRAQLGPLKLITTSFMLLYHTAQLVEVTVVL